MKRLTLYLMLSATALVMAGSTIPTRFAPLGRIGMGSTWTPANLNPAVWCPAEDTALDASGNGNDGTWSTTAAYAAGKVGYAFDFSNLERIDIGSIIPSGSVSISVWVKANSHKDYMWIAGAGVLAGSVSGCGIISTAVNWTFQNRTAGGVVNSASVAHGDSTAWTHLVGVRNGTDVRLYINGVLAATTASTITEAGSQPATIGARNAIAPFDYAFDGQIDDVLVFDYALSSAEITPLYNNSSKQGSSAWKIN